MELKEYLFRKKITVKKLAEDLMYSRSHINIVVNRKLIPGRKLGEMIEEYTNGEVTYKSMKRKKSTELQNQPQASRPSESQSPYVCDHTSTEVASADNEQKDQSKRT
ncbi:hypothetical protein UFOVP1357_29 [uncultured Caudovirales phage]|uniref:HTH_XRE domain containing protein n=1 Tax=uncultured Caudovirales phage TaxID=2100421 RepID=A0A6J5LDH4_9CAUD|nr:hypothetical protein UFOVP18_44 [uncultured Caudovirales phage]CAB4127033.1 hypothetical protein UFOVP82_46 [uncultured Caudovirales phage]CAB4132584.1 hypothetical protein UFOVP258_37 [uncultured Caudovirales phage]CAB4146487.1 hypothetical protein UFOVP502_29 [uncultured Caudovirales phage]CAB4200105.1 hypothetical protein UFOVP1357_29 [uncultured Caudovirales phage]